MVFSSRSNNQDEILAIKHFDPGRRCFYKVNGCDYPLCKNGLLSRKKLQCLREEANEQYNYVVAIVKRTAGCAENQGIWPWANRQHVYLVSEVKISNLK